MYAVILETKHNCSNLHKLSLRLDISKNKYFNSKWLRKSLPKMFRFLGNGNFEKFAKLGKRYVERCTFRPNVATRPPMKTPCVALDSPTK